MGKSDIISGFNLPKIAFVILKKKVCKRQTHNNENPTPENQVTPQNLDPEFMHTKDKIL